ncbi:MAG TPA: hypothetical protein PLJ97_02945, partial [Candidatus Saccharibacteria bacterium]|nr:hypothetical protein [Candidatus Saccharibacteria bacterium]
AMQSLWVNSGNYLYASSTSWNVGIGTTSPAYRLEVNNNTSAPILGISAISASGSVFPELRLVANADNVNRYGRIYYTNATGGTGSDLAIWNQHSNIDSDIQFHLGGAVTPSVIFKGSGKVGIGTTSPSVSLAVNGYAIASTPTAGGHLATKAYVDSASQSLWVKNGSNLYASSTSWNVGIGTTNPSYKLDVNGNIAANALRFNASTKYSTEISLLLLTDNKRNIVFNNIFTTGENLSAGTIKIVARKRDNNGSPNGILEKTFSFWVSNGVVGGLQSTVNAVLGDMSNVRIGEPFIDSDMYLKIPVYSAQMGSGRNIYFEIIIEGSTAWVSKLANISYDSSTPATFPGQSYPTIASRLGIGLGNDVMPASSLQVGGNALFSGNVGIGTTSPSYKLDVNGGGSFTQVVFVPTPSSGGHAANKDYVDTVASAAASALWVKSGSNLYASSTSWNVGIGTTNPGAKLDINATGTSSTKPALSILGNGSWGSGYQVAWGNYAKLSQTGSGAHYISWGMHNDGSSWFRDYTSANNYLPY